jgi:DNA-binding MarR family transcriptional regulator
VSAVHQAPLDRTANLLGVLSLTVADRTADAVSDASGQSRTAATALSALYHFLDGPSVDLLGRVLGLTPSGTVRLVDRLEQAGYAARRSRDGDARSVSVWLTASGRGAAQRVSGARATMLEDALAELPPEERQTLDRIVSRLLVGMIRGPGAIRWMCRLCDTTACGRDQGSCPVANAAKERYATSSNDDQD